MTAVARIRSSVSTSEVYSTSGKPQNSLPVDLSTTSPVRPEMTISVSPSLRTTVVLASAVPLENAWSCGPTAVEIRSQEYCSTAIRAPVTCSYLST